MLSFKGRATEPVTMQLKEPEVKTMQPKSQVKNSDAFLDLIMPRLLTMISMKPAMPPERSIKYKTAPMRKIDINTIVLELDAKTLTML